MHNYIYHISYYYKGNILYNDICLYYIVRALIFRLYTSYGGFTEEIILLTLKIVSVCAHYTTLQCGTVWYKPFINCLYTACKC